MNMNALEKCSGDRRKEGSLHRKFTRCCGCMQTLRALLPRSNARLLPVLREDAEGSDGAWPESAAASSAGAAASDRSPEQQPAASREGSPVQALLSAIGVQIPTGDYQEGELTVDYYYNHHHCYYITRCFCQRQGESADKLQGKAATVACDMSNPSRNSPDPSKTPSTVGTVLSIVASRASRGYSCITIIIIITRYYFSCISE